jgi:hypothetical protein
MTESYVKKTTLFLKSAFILLAIMLALGCTKAGPEIVGLWDNVNAIEIVEFKPDGTGVFTYQNSQIPPLAFSWKRAVQNSYIMDVNFKGSGKTLTATVSGKGLSIESTMGKELYQKHISSDKGTK